jgi:CrcB protein
LRDWPVFRTERLRHPGLQKARWSARADRHRRAPKQGIVMNPYLLVAVGGALGSVARYGTGVLVGKAWNSSFPLGTMLINIAGSLAMGLFIGYLVRTTPSWQADARLFVAVGMFGGFTTFSSFSLDAIAMFERGEIGLAVLYVLVSVIVGIAALYGGLLVMRGAA